MPALAALIERIRSEYLALPALKLTAPQARRLWPASDDEFAAAIDALVAEGFLRCLPSGSYIAVPRPQGTAAKADMLPLTSQFRCPHCHKRNAVDRKLTFEASGSTVRCVACGRVLTVSAFIA
jgi:hypothetical protein